MRSLQATHDLNGLAVSRDCDTSVEHKNLNGLKLYERPEAQLLLLCARVNLDQAGRERLEFLLREELDWKFLFEKAERNYVVPLLVWHLINHGEKLIPEGLMNNIMAYHIKHAAENLFQTRELLKILHSLSAKGIRALPFKGPTLAAIAYGNLSLRQYSDIDILVNKNKVLAAVDLLAEQGFAPVCSLAELKKSLSLGSNQKDVGLISKDGKIRVEMHWRLSRRYFIFALDSERNMRDMWGRIEFVPLAGSEVPSMPVVDLLIYLCQHGSKHAWERLEWITDVAELIRKNPEFDWDHVYERARLLGCERVLSLGVYLASELLDAPLPANLRAELGRDPMLYEILSDTREALFSDESQQAGAFDKHCYRLILKERWSDKLSLCITYSRIYLRIFLTPNSKDRELFGLPDSMQFIYYFSRPLRLVLEYPTKFIGRLLRKNDKET